MPAIPDALLARYKLEATSQDDGKSVAHPTTIVDESSKARAELLMWTDKKKLGTGGYGSVILQKNTNGNLRAVKRLFPRKGVNYSREIAALAKVSDRHDLFVHFFGWYESGNSRFIAMEFIEHGDLSKLRLEAMRPNAKEITKQIVQGLIVLHDRMICHRDLKPQNILIASPDPIRIKIADFGSSKDLEGTQPRTSTGTEGYLAPELLRLWPVGPDGYTNAVDLWALGCLVHWMLTGQVPFVASIDVSDLTISGISVKSDPSPQMDLNLLYMFCKGEAPLPLDQLQRSGADDLGIGLVKDLLHADPSSRLSAPAALEAPWLLQATSSPDHDANDPSSEEVDKDGAHSLVLLAEIEPNKTIQTLVDQSIGINERNKAGKRLISTAVQGDLETVKLFLDHDVDIEVHDDDGKTALLGAVMAGYSEVVRLLLDHGASMAAKDKQQSSALHLASVQGNTAVSELLLERRAYLEDSEWGIALLLLVVSEEHKKAISFLLSSHIDLTWTIELLLKKEVVVTQAHNNGYTALLYAMWEGSTETILFLLDHGVDLAENDSGGVTALLLAASKGRNGIVNLLLDRGAALSGRFKGEFTALLTAAVTGNTETVSLLLDRGADIDQCSNFGFTALYFTAFMGNNETVALLLDRGATVSGRIKGGHTALLSAASVGNTETVSLLLDRGADIDQCNDVGFTALTLAVMYGHNRTVSLLLDRGATLSRRIKGGLTALSFAAWVGNTKAVSLLLDRGIGITQNGYGDTALHFASSKGYNEIVNLLLNRMDTRPEEASDQEMEVIAVESKEPETDLTLHEYLVGMVKDLRERQRVFEERERALDEKERAFEERKRAFEEEKKAFEERKRALDEKERAFNEKLYNFYNTAMWIWGDARGKLRKN